MLKVFPSLQEVLPTPVAMQLLEAFDNSCIYSCTGEATNMAEDSDSSWIFVAQSQETSWGSDDFKPLDGDEEVLLIQLKHCQITPLLLNIGFKLSTPTYTPSIITSWGDHLSAHQQSLKQLAVKMCFKSFAPKEVIEGTMSLKDMQFQGAPLQEYLDHRNTIPFPCSSISPIYASGALVFVNPAITRDLPDMMEQVRRSHRVGMGTLIVSKSLQSMVMNVLNPGNMTIDGSFTQPNRAAFVKSRTVIDLPDAPGGSFRCQGRVSAEDRAGDGAAAASHQPLPLDSQSIETRMTRTTGDLPLEMSESRPNECDWRHRPPLHGHLRVELGADGYSKSTTIHQHSPGQQQPPLSMMSVRMHRFLFLSHASIPSVQCVLRLCLLLQFLQYAWLGVQ